MCDAPGFRVCGALAPSPGMTRVVQMWWSLPASEGMRVAVTEAASRMTCGAGEIWPCGGGS